MLSVLLCGLSATGIAAPMLTNEIPSFDTKPWLEDLNQAENAVVTKYANLEWLAFEREVKLSALFADARDEVRSATSVADVKAAFDELAHGFGDGHVRFDWPRTNTGTGVHTADCGALGFYAGMQGVPTAALIQGYVPLETAQPNVFPAGLIHSGHRIVGVLKIGVFTPDGYPELCEAAETALRIQPHSNCDESCSSEIKTWATNRMTRELTSQVERLRAAGASVLMIDLIDNGGGTEWAEVAARIVTGVPLRSERIAFVHGLHWVKNFETKELELRAAAETAAPDDRVTLIRFADAVASRRQDAAIACGSRPLLERNKPSCPWLGTGFFATGILDAPPSANFRDKPWARMVFAPFEYEYREAVWRGPLILLVKGAPDRRQSNLPPNCRITMRRSSSELLQSGPGAVTQMAGHQPP